jgi:hypothetical protein
MNEMMHVDEMMRDDAHQMMMHVDEMMHVHQIIHDVMVHVHQIHVHEHNHTHV